jgi:hypothetical protein
VRSTVGTDDQSGDAAFDRGQLNFSDSTAGSFEVKAPYFILRSLIKRTAPRQDTFLHLNTIEKISYRD